MHVLDCMARADKMDADVSIWRNTNLVGEMCYVMIVHRSLQDNHLPVFFWKRFYTWDYNKSHCSPAKYPACPIAHYEHFLILLSAQTSSSEYLLNDYIGHCPVIYYVIYYNWCSVNEQLTSDNCALDTAFPVWTHKTNIKCGYC